MGCSQSQEATPHHQVKVNEVDLQLARAREEERNHYKVLLLGPGEAGKSTVLKQLKCIYKGGIPIAEQRMHGRAILKNTIQCMQAILEAMRPLGLSVDSRLRGAKNRVAALDESGGLTPAIAKDIAGLWKDKGVQLAYGQRHRFWILDAAAYYFKHVERFASEGFSPNEEDMIMARARTSGIIVTQITDGPHKFSVVDVGGQRSERRKWIHCFDDVKAIIFVVALSGYNQVLFEDTSVNRMHESLKLFEDVVRNPVFQSTPVFMLLNKKDIFEQLISQGVSLSKCFPDYRGGGSGPRDVHTAIKEIERRFRMVMQMHCPRKQIHTHVVAARVRLDMKVAFTDVKDRIKQYYASNDAGNGGSHSSSSRAQYNNPRVSHATSRAPHSSSSSSGGGTTSRSSQNRSRSRR